MRRSATCTPVDARPETIARVIIRAAGWPSRETTTVAPRSSCVPNAMPSRTATSGVTSTLIVPTTPSRENSDRTPRDSQTRFCRIWAPASIVLYGYTRTSGPISGLLADDALVAERRALVDAHTRAQVAVAPDGRAADDRRTSRCACRRRSRERCTDAPGLDA